MIMMDSLKDAGKNISRGLSRTWDQITERWRDLVHHSSNALTHFVRRKDEENKEQGSGTGLPAFRSWSLLAGDMEETDKEIVVRIEAPGMDKKDWQITVDGPMLYLKGEKRFERSSSHSTYHVMERAYGVFERAIPLPREVDADNAQADYTNGVLTVRLPKQGGEQGRLISIS
jgi:HSP20 family protein